MPTTRLRSLDRRCAAWRYEAERKQSLDHQGEQIETKHLPKQSRVGQPLYLLVQHQAADEWNPHAEEHPAQYAVNTTSHPIGDVCGDKCQCRSKSA